MAKVILDMTVSLDGFIGGTPEFESRLHKWFFSPTEQDTRVINESIQNTGSVIIGRKTYNQGDENDAFVDHPHKLPHFVLTHTPPEKPAKGTTPFIFITDGVESALKQAKAVAGDKDVGIGGGATCAQQYIQSGLLDEIQIHLVPILFGEGIRLFDSLATVPIELDCIRTIQTPNATHLLYRVVK